MTIERFRPGDWEAREDARWTIVEGRVARILEREPQDADKMKMLQQETRRTIAELNDQLNFYPERSSKV